MKFLSLFSGIEAASMAWLPLGWECVAVAEVDAAASAVLAYRHPSVPNLGDVTKITESTIAALGQIDLVVFGSPCQDLSVAGKRAGLSGARSGLFHTAVGIVRWAREHGGCRFALWENVPGAFSSNQGRDFAVVVGALAGLGHVDVPANGWGSEGCALGDDGLLEWSTLDAQWFGVAQRRRRVFALADFGAWQSRRPILLEPQSLRGDSPPRREPGQNAAGTLAASSGGSDENDAADGRLVAAGATEFLSQSSRVYLPGGVAPTLQATGSRLGNRAPQVLGFGGNNQSGPIDVATACRAKGGTGHGDFESETFLLQPVAFSCKDHGADAGPVSPTLRAMGYAGSHANAGGQVAIAFDSRQDRVSSEHAAGALGVSQPQAQAVCVTGEVTHTLRAEGFDASEDGTGRGQPIVAAYGFQPRIARNGRGDMGDLVSALNAQSGETGKGDAAPCVAVAFQDRFRGDDGRGYDRPPPLSVDQVGTLETVKPWNVAMSMAVRRLTPLECERLQGFPDQYTRIPVRRYAARRISKTRPADYWEQIDGAWWLMMADGPRYKMLGNSMAVPVMRWIGRAIDAAVRGEA